MRISPRQLPPLVNAPLAGSTPAARQATQKPSSSFTPRRPRTRLPELPGLSTLSPELQARVKLLSKGKSQLATRFRLAEAQLRTQADYLAATPEVQGQYIFGAMHAALPGTVAPEPRTHLPTPATVSRGPIERVEPFEFHGATGPAEVMKVTIDGQSITIAAPADGKYTPTAQHTLEEVVRTLAALPAVSRKNITSVHLNPVANPDDAFWAATYGNADAVSYMTCGAAGGVTIYPAEQKYPDDIMRTSMIHETGHAWSMKTWGEAGTGAEWDRWANATASDLLNVSHYGQSSLLEDVAEASALYLESKGTPSFAEYRAIYPARFAILDQVLGGRS